MTDTPDYAGLGGVKKRGSSTASRPKYSMSIEVQDPDLVVPNPVRPAQKEHPDMEAEIFGLPLESDFVLYGAYNFDHALMRNAFIYEVSNQVGRYAARTRFCEVWLNVRTGPVTNAHYLGVYSFMERLTRNVNRINVRRVRRHHTAEPEITGGYIFKQDRKDPGESGFSGGGYGSLVWVDPDEHEVLPQQRSWLVAYLNQVNAAVRTRDPAVYGQLIDIEAWLDHHILNVFPKNVDAFRLSGYMYKEREEKFVLGPIWDFDRAMGSTDGRDRYWNQWPNSGGDGGTSYFAYGWYGPLFGNQPPTGDDPWAVMYRARWRELRAGPLSSENVLGIIDDMAAEVGEAADRDWVKWRQGTRDYTIRVNQLRTWIERRLDWIDAQFTEPPEFDPPSGEVDEGAAVTLSAVEGEIFYTVDGPDPRGGDGQPAAEALRYEGPITITRNTKIQARARIGGSVWSPLVEQTYYTYLLPLVITELMYNPPPDPATAFFSTYFEYIELQNVGDVTIPLAGVSFVDRVRFSFSDGAVETLAPGEYVLIVRNREAFDYLYGAGKNIAGEFSSNLSNRLMPIKLVGPVGEPLMDFEYRDSWHPSTDGEGHSLVIIDPRRPRASWNDAESWRASIEVLGSPGDDDVDRGGMQLPGDYNQDGRITVSDPVSQLKYQFGLASDLPCDTEEGRLTLLDTTGDGRLNIADVLWLLSYQFLSGPPPVLGATCRPIEGCPDVCP
jgi:hypothetical protein